MTIKCPKCGSDKIFRATAVTSKVVKFGWNEYRRIYDKRYTCYGCGHRFDIE